MPENIKRAADDSARVETTDDKLNKLLAGLNTLVTRMDAQEERLGEVEKKACDVMKRHDDDDDDKKVTDDDDDDKAAKADAKKRRDAEPYAGKETPEEEEAEMRELAGAKPDDDDDDDRKAKDDSIRADTKRKSAKDAEEPIPPAAAADSALKAMAEEIAVLKSRMPKALTDSDYAEMAKVHSAADSVYMSFGERAPNFSAGDTIIGYRKRLAAGLAARTKDFSGMGIYAMADSDFSIVEPLIYAAAADSASAPTNVTAGVLRPVSVTRNGHTTTTYVGDPKAAFAAFSDVGANYAFVRPDSNVRN